MSSEVAFNSKTDETQFRGHCTWENGHKGSPLKLSTSPCRSIRNGLSIGKPGFCFLKFSQLMFSNCDAGEDS